jgi:hypothetical protein
MAEQWFYAVGDERRLVHPYAKLLVLVVVGWYLVLAILKQALAEVEQARQAAAA